MTIGAGDKLLTLEDLGCWKPADSQALTPIEKVYFTGAAFSKYEPATDAMQRVVDSNGAEEDWEVFEEHMQKYLSFEWCSNWDGKKYDIVFYGVSGYTGYLMISYLQRVALKTSKEPFTFAVAGRTASKVVAVRDKELGGTKWADTPILTASFDDPVSMMDLAKSAHVVVNVAGPYMLSAGEILVDACVRHGCHYCDVSGEIPWTLRVVELHERARAAGVKILPSSAVAGGYPDLCVSMIARNVRETHKEELRKATVYFTGGGSQAGTSGGTLATRGAMSQASDEVRKKMADPFSLGGFVPLVDRNGFKEVTIAPGTGVVTPKMRREDQDALLSKVAQDPDEPFYRAPNVYAYFDTRVVRKSNALLASELNQPYGRQLNFTQFSKVPAEVMTAAASAKASGAGAAAGGSGVSASSEKEMLEQAGQYYNPGDGPRLEELDDAWIGLFARAESENGHVVKMSLIGRDGYFETARCAVESALTCRFDGDRLAIRGGVLNTAAVGQNFLATRVINSGIKFKMGEWHTAADESPPADP